MHAWELYSLNDPLNRYDPDGLRAMSQSGTGGGTSQYSKVKLKPSPPKKKVYPPLPPPPHKTTPSYAQQDYYAQQAAAAAAAFAKAEAERKAKEKAEAEKRAREKALEDLMMKYQVFGGECEYTTGTSSKGTFNTLGALREKAQAMAKAQSISNLSATLAKIGLASVIALLSGSATLDDITEDMRNYDFLNSDADKAARAKVFSSYYGTPVINQDITPSSFQLGNTIMLKPEQASGTTIKHEWGHAVHESMIGTLNYIPEVAIPSVAANIEKVPTDKYYSLKQESIADYLGNVNRVGYKYE